MTRPPALLIVGAGPLQLHAIQEARRCGLLPLVTDRNAEAPGIANAERWYPVDTMDVPGHAAVVSTIAQDYSLR